MKVLMSGATGFVGSRLRARLEAAGHQVQGISRSPGAEVSWEPESLARAVREADAVIHLAGENLFAKRWSKRQKEILVESRTGSTRRLARLVVEHQPRVYVNASAIGYYGPSEREGITEEAEPGIDFLANLCRRWEEATEPIALSGVRTAIVRIGVVLGTEGGALKTMLLPFKLGLGGPLGDGRQWFSWIHIDDLAALFQHILENDELSGVFNATAPEPVTFKTFAKTLGRVLHRPAFLPAPAFAVRLALGEVADVLLSGQHVLPKHAQDTGFEFAHPQVEGALQALLAR